jgi:hypothetical protein
MLKGIIKAAILLLAAAVTGIFADQVVWPYAVERPLFYKYKLEQGPVYVTEKLQTTIQENTALKDAIEKVQRTVVSVKSTTAKGAVFEGTGLILTGDGLVVTLSDSMPANSKAEVAVDGGKTAFQVLKRDKNLNLALIKVEKNNLPTTSFYPIENMRLGERIFLLGKKSSKIFANEGIVRSFNNDAIETNIIDSAEAAGSPVFDIEGNIVGLAAVAKDGKVSAIPVSKIRGFSGL